VTRSAWRKVTPHPRHHGRDIHRRRAQEKETAIAKRPVEFQETHTRTHPTPVSPQGSPLSWYAACEEVSKIIGESVPEPYRSRTFTGILGDIKALSPKKATSLMGRKKGLGLQYAYLYLTKGIDGGRGYQACAAEALSHILGPLKDDISAGAVLDVGCAVGVTAGVLSLDRVVGFDLFPELLKAAKKVDSITGSRHGYVVADMTRPWPFDRTFDTVVCGLVCHHLKEQRDVVTFFGEANRVLETGGKLVMTLPSGSIASGRQFAELVEAVESFGFEVDRRRSGLVHSADSDISLFWMFCIIAEKVSEKRPDVFVNRNFGFQDFRTPVTREQKGMQARLTAGKERRVRHTSFSLMNAVEICSRYGEEIFIYENLSDICRTR